MHPDDDQLGDYKAAMDSLNNAENCDSCGKKIQKGDGFNITTKRGIQSFHKDANKCASAPENRKPAKLASVKRMGQRHTSNSATASATEIGYQGTGI